MIALEVDRQRVVDFCQRWQVTELSLFGSALRGELRPGSDVDLLVTFAPSAHRSLRDLAQMEDELAAIFGHPVDLVSRQAVEQSENYIRRKHILETAQVIYVA